MMPTVITFNNVSKNYHLYHHIVGGLKHLLFNFPRALRLIKNSRYEALKDISFEVKKGEALGVIGRNGAGKSTALGLLAGVLKPTRGKVTVRGKVLPLLDIGAGFHPDLTGIENIVLSGVLLGHTRSAMLKKTGQIAEFAQLGEFIEEPVRVYSRGMLARLGFSVIACLEPEILLIDEVLEVGDIDFRKKSFHKILELKKSGVTIIFVSHILEDILKISDRVLWIENHGIKMLGDPETVVAQYFASNLLKKPHMQGAKE